MLTFLPLEQIDEMDSWEGAQLNEAKEILAYELTQLVHGKEEADKAQAAARAAFQGGNFENIPETVLSADDLNDGSIGILTLMVKAGLVSSNKEARTLVTQGGVSVDGEKVTAPNTAFTADQLSGEGVVVKKGKKVYHKVRLG